MVPHKFTPPPLDWFGAIMVIMYGLICLVGMVGNALVIFVILRYVYNININISSKYSNLCYELIS